MEIKYKNYLCGCCFNPKLKLWTCKSVRLDPEIKFTAKTYTQAQDAFAKKIEEMIRLKIPHYTYELAMNEAKDKIIKKKIFEY